MKKFLRTLILFILIVGVITVGINGLYLLRENQMPDTMSDERNNNSQIKNVPNGIQICNLGSSHGLYGFNYTDLSNEYVCYNFGQPSQRLSYDYIILCNFIDRFDDGAIVFIPISHFSFFGPPETSYDNFASLNKRYYKFLPDDLIKEYDAKTDFFVNYAPALSADSVVDLFRTLLGKGTESFWGNSTTAEGAKEHGYNRYKTFVESKLGKEGNRWYNDEEIQALYDIIKLCRDHGLTPVLITTPMLSEYTDAVTENDPEFFGDFYGVIDEVVEKTNVIYLDYSADKNFCNNYSLFYNSDHLNREGARRFTDMLIEDVFKQNANLHG